ncbi:acyl-CoA dehydrogenase [Olivibacter sp. SDN3]|uniref:acyl-CoA dehydrogenase n=1 Tax=Olivibacter sp. SDN3 TaxID=2764720 RepID=UPI0016512AEA|nr:acyl-CoA dehydrogenase [Olivibacter sp. SDN3]QNL48897.1 acyl-CoA dehydrogenase [Olivibacter sp. SDN3]
MDLPKVIVDDLRREAFQAEILEKPTSKQLAIIYDNKWFKMFVPEKYGGLNLSLIEGLKLEEALAEVDGSIGWTVTLCSGATMFVGYIAPDVSDLLFQNEKVCFGGSGKVSGVAEVVDDGYRITGIWKYATGAPHNSVFTANCQIIENGKIVRGNDRMPLIKSFLLLNEEVVLHNDWQTMGLKATAGWSFEVKDLLLDKNRCFQIDNRSAMLDNPIYQYPFLQFAESTLAVNTLGMTKRFFTLFEQIIDYRDKETEFPAFDRKKQRNLLTNAQKELDNISNQFYQCIYRSWNQLVAIGHIDKRLLGEISRRSRQLVKNARLHANNLYPYGGMAAATTNEEINLVWRNLFTASQHSLLL